MLGLRAGKFDLFLAGDLDDDGCFIQNVEHAVACGKGVLQRRAKVRKRNRGTER